MLDYARVLEAGLKKAGCDQKKKYPIVGKIKDASVRKAVKDALDDNGKLSLQEVKLVCESALDRGNVSRQEIADLKRLATLAKSMNSESIEFLRKFIRKHE